MTERGLEKMFRRAAQLPPGGCPLPDPLIEGEREITHVEMVRVERQPPLYNYDAADNTAEALRFTKDLEASVSRGEITEQEARRILEALRN